MTTLQGNYNSMFMVVEKAVVEAPPGLIAAIPGAVLLFDEYAATLKLLNDSGAVQSTNISGSAQRKLDLKLKMIAMTVSLCKSVKSYAVTAEDIVLQREMRWSRSSLLNMPAVSCANTCINIVRLTEPLLPVLVDYEVDLASLAAVENSINAYKGNIAKPRAKIIKRSNATKTIAKRTRKCMDLLDKMDILIGPLENKEPAFFAKYFASRRLVLTGSRKLSLRGVVMDAEGRVLEKVQVLIDGHSVKRTTAKGRFQYSHLKSGMHRIIFRRIGLTDLIMNVAVVEGMRTDLVVEMEEVSKMSGLWMRR